MDALLLDLQNVSEQLLPILGAVALIFLCILLKKLWNFVEELTVTVKNLDPTLKKVDESVEKIQAPLDTAVRYSHSLDKVHEKTSEMVGKAVDFANENLGNLKNKFAEQTDVPAPDVVKGAETAAPQEESSHE